MGVGVVPVAAGVVRIVGVETADILREAGRLLTDPAAYAAMAKGVSPYGDGKASERIAASLEGVRVVDLERLGDDGFLGQDMAAIAAPAGFGP